MSVDEIDTVVQAVVAQKMYLTILKNIKLTAMKVSVSMVRTNYIAA